VTSTIGFGTADELPVSLQIPGYRLRRPVGSDAVGLWFDCEQTSLGRKLTIKVLKPQYEQHAGAHRDFLAEMDRLIELQHPHLLTVIDSRREDPLALVTERITAQTLATMLEPGKPIPPDEALKHALGCAQALAYLHSEGFTHKNFTPRLVSISSGGVGRIVTFRNIVPFKELAALRSKLVQDPLYIAPEQIGGEDEIGPKASTYQLGAILFHLLAGAAPHSTGDAKAIALAHYREPFPSLKSRQPFLKSGILDLVGACTRKDPVERPEMSEVVERIEAILEGKDDDAGGATSAPRARRRRRRR